MIVKVVRHFADSDCKYSTLANTQSRTERALLYVALGERRHAKMKRLTCLPMYRIPCHVLRPVHRTERGGANSVQINPRFNALAKALILFTLFLLGYLLVTIRLLVRF